MKLNCYKCGIEVIRQQDSGKATCFSCKYSHWRNRKERMRSLHKRGWTTEEIGAYFDVSGRRIREILEGEKRIPSMRCYFCRDFIIGKEHYAENRAIDEGCYLMMGMLMKQRSVKIPLKTAKAIMKTFFEEETPEVEEVEETTETTEGE